MGLEQIDPAARLPMTVAIPLRLGCSTEILQGGHCALHENIRYFFGDHKVEVKLTMRKG